MFRLFGNIFNSQGKIILGRCNYTKIIGELDRKIYLANYDHYGLRDNLYYSKKRLPKHLTMTLEDLLLVEDKKYIHRMIKSEK